MVDRELKIGLLYQGYLYKDVKLKGYNAIGNEKYDCYIRVTFIYVAVMTGSHCTYVFPLTRLGLTQDEKGNMLGALANDLR